MADGKGESTSVDPGVVFDAWGNPTADVQAGLDADAANAAGDSAGKGAGEDDTLVDDKGQSADSPPAKGASASGSPTDTDTVDEGAGKPEAAKDDEGKPLPYDKDPKWLAARAAQKAVDEILDKHGLDSIDDLQAQLETGRTLQGLLGSRDAKKIVEEYEEFQRVKAFWADEEAKRQEEGETAEETIERLKSEKAALEEGVKTRAREEAEQKESREALNQYAATVNKLLGADESIPDGGKELVTLMLGLDNPADTIDIQDRAEVAATAKLFISKLQNFAKVIGQRAVDAYAKGKGEFQPVGRTETHESVDATKPKALPDDATIDDVIKMGNSELLEILEKGADALGVGK